MKNFFSILIIIGLMFLISCTKKQEEKRPVTTDSLSVDSLHTGNSANQQSMEGPQWIKTPPSQEGFIYVVGKGESRSKTIAREKAIMNAQVALAEMLKKEKSGTSPDSLNVYLKMSHVAKEKSLKKGKHWQHFVLVEMPTR